MSRAVLRWIAATFVAVGSLPGRAVAQAVFLQIRPAAGDTIHLRLEQIVEMTGTTRVGARDSTISVTTSMSIMARAIVVSSDSASSYVVAVTDSVAVAGTPAGPNDAQERARQALRGTRAEMRVFPDGSSQIVSDAGKITTELRSLIAQMPATLPKLAVQVGESWTKLVTVPIEGQGGVVSPASLRTTFRFDSLSRNREIAYISMQGELTRTAADSASGATRVEMTGTLKGEMTVDRKRGWMTDSHAVIKLKSILPPVRGSTGNPVHFNLTITQRMRALDKR